MTKNDEQSISTKPNCLNCSLSLTLIIIDRPADRRQSNPNILINIANHFAKSHNPHHLHLPPRCDQHISCIVDDAINWFAYICILCWWRHNVNNIFSFWWCGSLLLGRRMTKADEFIFCLSVLKWLMFGFNIGIGHTMVKSYATIAKEKTILFILFIHWPMNLNRICVL